jgi:hypothetical protein
VGTGVLVYFWPNTPASYSHSIQLFFTSRAISFTSGTIKYSSIQSKISATTLRKTQHLTPLSLYGIHVGIFPRNSIFGTVTLWGCRRRLKCEAFPASLGHPSYTVSLIPQISNNGTAPSIPRVAVDAGLSAKHFKPHLGPLSLHCLFKSPLYLPPPPHSK